MTTRETAQILKQLSLLMELHGENDFKAKAIGNAAFRLGKSGINLEGLSIEELEKVDGIGKSIAAKIHEIQTTGTLHELETIMMKTPVGVAEMLTVKGIGPKKVRTIWKDLGAESLIELLYACNENRLILLDGFGAKTQESVKKAIEFSLSNAGKVHFATAEVVALELEKYFNEKFGTDSVSLTGSIRRKCEIIDCVELLIATNNPEELKQQLNSPLINQETISFSENEANFETLNRIKVKVYVCRELEFTRRLFETTGTAKHIIDCHLSKENQHFNTEQEIYESIHLPFIIPEMREGLNEVELARSGKLTDIIELNNLRGILHNHTTYSDGLNTLSEMAERCKNDGYEYLGICDHSQTAVYANGLKPERILQQQQEIDLLNKKLFPFRIFKGIESDILNDGSLDYENSVLKTFDFVVASVHSNLKMNEENATERLIKAIENPYTSILGHPTGRLLLAREGYPINHKKIIEACAENNVIIELNAHPYRLDIDWRWINYATERGVMISINPDAHSVNGYADMYYGVCVARKGGLTNNKCFNVLTCEEISRYFSERKNKIP